MLNIYQKYLLPLCKLLFPLLVSFDKQVLNFNLVPLLIFSFMVSIFCAQFKKYLPTSGSLTYLSPFWRLFCFTFHFFVYNPSGIDVCMRSGVNITPPPINIQLIELCLLKRLFMSHCSAIITFARSKAHMKLFSYSLFCPVVHLLSSCQFNSVLTTHA